MTARVNALAAPALREALTHDGKFTLYVHNLIDPAHGEVPAYANANAGDLVKFLIETSTGNTWCAEHALTEPERHKPVVFAVSKAFFENETIPGTTTELRYTITNVNGDSAMSPSLTVHLEM
ncbi:hypothetical protein ACIQVE_26795 [Pseudomonas sp. NPDC098747]|uniref:hypothetical protein n=1 Tax=Pseudomonas sp. NPDC098747 TaxID=3364487 RepID=UPI00383ADF9A